VQLLPLDANVHPYQEQIRSYKAVRWKHYCKRATHVHERCVFKYWKVPITQTKRSICIIENIIVYSWLVSSYGSMLWSWGDITKRKEKKRNLSITVFGSETKYLNHSKILIFYHPYVPYK
jgi:hypothetical protein